MNLTPEELKTIQKIAAKVKTKYKFGYYDADDIESECFLIAIKALPRYDATLGTLENFLFTHVKNRLRSLIRTKYARKCPHCQHGCPKCRRLQEYNDRKKNLMEPLDIDFYEDDEKERHMYYEQEHLDKMEYDETILLINRKLPVEFRADYLRMLDGAYVSPARRKNVEQAILEILEDRI